MVSNAFRKTYLRTFLSNKGRFLANFLTVFFAVGISGGLAALPKCYEKAYAENYIQGNAPDLIIKSKGYTGFSDGEISEISSYEGVTQAEAFFTFDGEKGDGTYHRYYFLDLKNQTIAKPELQQGRLPEKEDEVLVELGNRNRLSYAVGDVIHLSSANMFTPSDLTVVGVVASPLYASVAKERAAIEGDQIAYVSSVFYFAKDYMPSFSKGLHSDIYLRMNIERTFFSDEYRETMNKHKEVLLTRFGEENIAVLTLEENTSYALFHNYSEKIASLGYILPLFFLAVCALINHIAVVRLIKDERPLIAVYSSLGVNKAKIAWKYISFIAFAVLFGGIAGYFLGVPLLPQVVISAFQSLFRLTYCPVLFHAPLGWAVFGVLLLLSVGVATYSSVAYLRQEPSELVHNEAPMPGKKILLERVAFLWKRLPFSLKSTFRNIFRQKKNFWLTATTVGGATLLILAGFGLLNVSYALTNDDLYADVASSMGFISTIIVLLAVGMSLPTIYALCSMNIADRRREIATLKVLGYHDRECSGYTFREIAITAGLSSIVSLPFCALILHAVLRYLDFGSIFDVQWWSYVASVGIIMAVTFGIGLLLHRRVVAIDMNASLKTIE